MAYIEGQKCTSLISGICKWNRAENYEIFIYQQISNLNHKTQCFRKVISAERWTVIICLQSGNSLVLSVVVVSIVAQLTIHLDYIDGMVRL